MNTTFSQLTILRREREIRNESAQQIKELIEVVRQQQQTITYLTDEEFRKFAFRLNYNKLITDYLENEGNGDKWV